MTRVAKKVGASWSKVGNLHDKGGDSYVPDHSAPHSWSKGSIRLAYAVGSSRRAVPLKVPLYTRELDLIGRGPTALTPWFVVLGVGSSVRVAGSRICHSLSRRVSVGFTHLLTELFTYLPGPNEPIYPI